MLDSTTEELRDTRDSAARLVARELLYYVRQGRDLNDRGPLDMLDAFLTEFEAADAAVEAHARA